MSMIQETPQKIHVKINKLLPWLDAALLMSLMIFVLSGIKLVPFHGDESTFIWMSQDYDSIVKQGELEGIVLVPEETVYDSDEKLRLSVGSILVFSIGMARDIASVDAGLVNRWDWNYPPDAGYVMWEENTSQGRLPDTLQLTLARVCSASMGSLSIIFFFLVAKKMFVSRLAAWTVAMLLATHGDILVNICRAMQEGPKFLFTSITLFIAVFILIDLKNDKLRRVLYAALGFASGLTLAAKQDAAPILVAIYISLAFIPLWQKRSNKINLPNIVYLFAATVLALASFLAFMPIFWKWWPNIVFLIGTSMLAFQIPAWKTEKLSLPLFITGFILAIGAIFLSPNLWDRFTTPFTGMIDVREIIVNSQINYLGSNGLPYLDTVDRKVEFLAKTVVRSNVMYREVPTFDIDPINKQISEYEASPLRGRIGPLSLDVLIAIFFFFGLWSLTRTSASEDFLLFSLFLVSACILFISVPLPWQRYYLILQIPYALIAGAGVRQAWRWVDNNCRFGNLLR